MNLADSGLTRAAKLQRTTPTPPPRARPGETVCYVRLDLSPPKRRAIRERSRSLGVSVDVLVTCCAELQALPRLALGALPKASTLVASAARRPERLPPTDDLRAWCSSLRGERRALPDDDLPEVLVPMRLASRLDADAWNTAVDSVLRGEVDLALQAERLAAAHALTLTEWGLAEALRDGVDG